MFFKGSLIATVRAAGREPSEAIIKLDEMLSLMTRAELEAIRCWLAPRREDDATH